MSMEYQGWVNQLHFSQPLTPWSSESPQFVSFVSHALTGKSFLSLCLSFLICNTELLLALPNSYNMVGIYKAFNISIYFLYISFKKYFLSVHALTENLATWQLHTISNSLPSGWQAEQREQEFSTENYSELILSICLICPAAPLISEEELEFHGRGKNWVD